MNWLEAETYPGDIKVDLKNTARLYVSLGASVQSNYRNTAQFKPFWLISKICKSSARILSRIQKLLRNKALYPFSVVRETNFKSKYSEYDKNLWKKTRVARMRVYVKWCGCSSRNSQLVKMCQQSSNNGQKAFFILNKPDHSLRLLFAAKRTNLVLWNVLIPDAPIRICDK